MSAEHDGLKLQATMAVQAYQKGREKQAPTAFDALYFIIDNAPDNPTGWLLLGWITGVLARDRATHLESEYDEGADAWYVKISDKDVNNTTEVVANLDWTRTGELVGIELLPGVSAPLSVPPIDPKTMASLRRGIADVEAGRVQPMPAVTQYVDLSDEMVVAHNAKVKQALADNGPLPLFIPANSCPACYPQICDITRPGCHKRAGLK
jgi:hypothetical protein